MKILPAISLATLLTVSSAAHAQQSPEESRKYSAALEGISTISQETGSHFGSRKSPQVYVSGNLLLMDAKYRYNERSTETGELPIFLSAGCDIYQIVITVLEGGVTLLLTQADSAAGVDAGTTIYPDKLTKDSGMFSYTLYADRLFKGFGIVNGDFNGDTSNARFTAFSYCFSTRSGAFDLFQDYLGVEH